MFLAEQTIRLEADQNPGHPGFSQPRVTVEACGTNSTGTFSMGKVDQALMDDEDVHIEIECMQIRDSYDPNEKKNSPAGIDADHIVLNNTLIDYVIHFQNTGSDTAYKVVVVDTLSADLDLSTLELGTSSHPYKAGISGEGKPVLTFAFDNIFLVDSTTNELKSHGFVKFKIKPRPTVALGTRINNSADIYFDYNLPVKTNTAFVTIGEYPVAVPAAAKEESSEIIVYPNPGTGKFRIESSGSAIESIEIFNFLGEKIYQRIDNQESIIVDLSSKPAGIYFLCIKTKGGESRIKVIKQ